MRSIFRYPGGKTRSTVQRWILDHRPQHVREYREPFVGGGGIFFAVKPSTVGVRWVNDSNAGLVAVYRALAERPEEFIRLCREVAPARADDPMTAAGVKGGLPQNARLKAVFDRVALNKDCDQAFRYFFINRTVFGGRVNYDRPSRLYFSKPVGWDVVKGDSLERAAEWLRGVRVTCGDFAPVLAEPGDDVWVYADPPYYRNTHFTGNSKLYQHSFTEADHRRLADAVKASPHKVCLSYDDDPDGVIRSLYPESEGFTLVEGEWAYCGSTNATKDRGRELLILNYPLPGAARTLYSVPAPRPCDLTPDEADELSRQEAVIDAGRRSPFGIGAALKAIRDGRLYRARFQTFEDYCRQRWDMSHRHANRLIECSIIVDCLGPMGPKQSISERHARELARLRTPDGGIDTAKVAETWDSIIKAGGAITAKLIREHIEQATGAEPPSKPNKVGRLKEWLRNLSAEERTELVDFLRREWADAFEPAQPLEV